MRGTTLTTLKRRSALTLIFLQERKSGFYSKEGIVSPKAHTCSCVAPSSPSPGPLVYGALIQGACSTLLIRSGLAKGRVWEGCGRGVGGV